MTQTYNVAIDVGGTFTDLIAAGTGGELVAIKVATTPDQPERGVLAALDALLERAVPFEAIDQISHASTIATNALLGQLGLELPRVVLVTTEGFRDIIEIGRQNRSSVYDLFVTRPRPLVAREDRIGARERMDHRGYPLIPLRESEVVRVVAEVVARAPGAIAIGFLHAYANDEHERRIADALHAALPATPISRSSDVDPTYREYERFSTTVVNAALLPIVQRYLDGLQDALRERGIRAPLLVMRSDGGMAHVDVAGMHPAMLIESGPAGGAIAAAALASFSGEANALSFDMGGTTAKAGTVVDGRVQLATEFEAAGATHSGRAIKGSGYPVRFPFVDLAEISAGGGTIAWIDDAGGLHVGPLSAGADPGPACYGRADLPTVTDANVVLGRLPQTHLLGGSFPIDAARSRAAIFELGRRLGRSLEQTAAHIVALVDAQMAKVLRIVTVERGFDPRDFTLIAFGGNGPLHACALADDLNVTRILVPPRPGLFSADGLLAADLRATFLYPVLKACDALSDAALTQAFARLEASASGELHAQGANHVHTIREADARYRGQSFELTVACDGNVRALSDSFHRAHQQRYGYAVRDEAVEIVNLRSTATATIGAAAPAARAAARLTENAPAATRAVWVAGAAVAVPVYQRRDLTADQPITGPALIEQYDAVTFVAPAWTLRTRDDLLVLER
jgi:N-methylhydantoinase A